MDGTPSSISSTFDGVRSLPPHGVSLSEAFRVWLRAAPLSFGGPAGRIADIHRILIEEKRWVSERRFLHAFNYSMLLPGDDALKLAKGLRSALEKTKRDARTDSIATGTPSLASHS